MDTTTIVCIAIIIVTAIACLATVAIVSARD